MLRSAFVKPDVHTSSSSEIPDVQSSVSRLEGSTQGSSGSHTENVGFLVPDDTVIIQFSDSIFFPNAARGKRTATEAIKLVYDKISGYGSNDRERSWSVAAERRVERLRKQYNVALKESPLSVVVWDFTSVSFIDVTAVLALGELKQDVRLHCGKEVQFRIVNMSPSVRERMLRAKWKLSDLYADEKDEDSDVVYPSLEKAVLHRDNVVLEGVTIGDEKRG